VELVQDGVFSDMAKQLSWGPVERNLRYARLCLSTPQDLTNLFGASDISPHFLVTRAVRRGDILKLRRGLYALTSPRLTCGWPTPSTAVPMCRLALPCLTTS
jgi:hypothetical protein